MDFTDDLVHESTMPAMDSPAILCARFLKANNYEDVSYKITIHFAKSSMVASPICRSF